MKKHELKKVLKPLIKECIKEVIFEDGTLSGIITEVAKGLNGVKVSGGSLVEQQKPHKTANFDRIKQEIGAASDIREHLMASREKLEGSTGLKGIFEGTQPLHSGGTGKSSQHGALRDMDPNDPGVDISGIIKVAGRAWDQLK